MTVFVFRAALDGLGASLAKSAEIIKFDSLIDTIRANRPDIPAGEDLEAELIWEKDGQLTWKGQTLDNYKLICDGTQAVLAGEPNVSGVNWGIVGYLMGGTPGNVANPVQK